MRKVAPFDRKASGTLTAAGAIKELQEKENEDKLKVALNGAITICGPGPFEGDVVRILADSLAGTKWCPDLLRKFIGSRRDVPDVWYDWVAGYAVDKYRP